MISVVTNTHVQIFVIVRVVVRARTRGVVLFRVGRTHLAAAVVHDGSFVADTFADGAAVRFDGRTVHSHVVWTRLGVASAGHLMHTRFPGSSFSTDTRFSQSRKTGARPCTCTSS